MFSRSISIGAALAIAGSIALATPVLAQKYGGTLKIGMNGDVKSPNFAKHSGNSVVQYGGLVAESLVDYDKQCNMVPGLAHKWDISADTKAVTYHLRKGILFHNGRELTADVVKKNVEWRLNKKNKSRSRNRFRRSGIKSMTVVDKYTIRFNLKKPSVAFFNLMEQRKAHILDPDSLNSKPPHPIGTGPFKFVEWKPSQYMKMVRFDKYWKKDKKGNRLPYVDTVLVKPIKDATTRFLALKSGDIDWSYGIPFDQIPEIRKNKPDWIKPQIEAGARWIFMHVQQSKKQDGPLRNKKVRQAVAHAIDKKEILQGLTWGIASVENQIFPPGHKWYHKNIPDPYAKPNVKAAKKLLAEAGYKDGVTLSMLVRNQTDHVDFATLVQAQLKKAGIKVVFKVLDYAAHRKVIRNPKGWDLSVGHYSFQPDPHWRYRSLLSSKSRTNYGKWKNKEADKLWAKADTVADYKKRLAIYRKALLILNGDVGKIFIGHMPNAKASRKGLNNYVSNCQGDTRWASGGAAHAWFANGKDSK
jgi:glutathione transport system substrate-binding protein